MNDDILELTIEELEKYFFINEKRIACIELKALKRLSLHENDYFGLLYKLKLAEYFEKYFFI